MVSFCKFLEPNNQVIAINPVLVRYVRQIDGYITRIYFESNDSVAVQGNLDKILDDLTKEPK